MKPVIALSDLEKAVGKQGAVKEIARQLRDIADHIELDKQPILINAKLIPAMDIKMEGEVEFWIYLSRPLCG